MSLPAVLARSVGRRQLSRTQSISTSRGHRSLFTIIHQGHEGWRLSFGRNPVKLEPGLRLMLPLYHTVQEVDMRERSVNITDLASFTSDNVPVLISGSLFFRVRNSYHACFSVDDFTSNVRNIGTSAVRSVIGVFSYDDVISDRNKINNQLHAVIGGSIEKWGVDCTRFEIQNFKPSNREVEKQLELQMAAERDRRKQLLDTQALVNVAEGHKQRTILESEGALQSQLNRAAGQKQKLIIESEGSMEAARNEGKALALQIEVVAQTLANGTGAPSDKDRAMALTALVELKRLEQLRAIASGSGNATYFFGDATKGVSGDAYTIDNMERWKSSISGRKGPVLDQTAV